jgi:hypothetical protein
MSDKIKIRYKNGDYAVGDMGSANGINVVGGFPSPKWPGYEEDIPATLLDNKRKRIRYKHPDQRVEFLSEYEHRKLLHKFGGFTAGNNFASPAPPARPGNPNDGRLALESVKLDGEEQRKFEWKQEVALHFYKEFNPRCMELISELSPEVIAMAKKDKDLEYLFQEEDFHDDKDDSGKLPDLTIMDPDSAINVIRQISDEKALTELSRIEARISMPRQGVLVEIENQLSKIKAKSKASSRGL